MFSEEEIEAIVLGSRWVADRADAALSQAARNALAKIAAVLPQDLKTSLDTSSLLIGPGKTIAAGTPNCRSYVPRYAANTNCASTISMAMAAIHGGHLAVRARLLRPGARRGGVVRNARGFSPFPDRPHQQGAGHGQALSTTTPGAAEGLACGGRIPQK